MTDPLLAQIAEDVAAIRQAVCPDDEWLTISQAAKHAGIHRSSLWRRATEADEVRERYGRLHVTRTWLNATYPKDNP